MYNGSPETRQTIITLMPPILTSKLLRLVIRISQPVHEKSLFRLDIKITKNMGICGLNGTELGSRI